MNTRLQRWLLALAVTIAAAPVSAQVADPKADFIQALGRFSLALDGAYGDEGVVIRSSLAAMEQGLANWDAAIRTYEEVMAADIGSATPEMAVRMHIAIGGVYLDRGRVDAARRAFAEARTLDANRAELHTFEGLIQSQLLNAPPAATEAFRRALALDPDNRVRAYMLANHLRNLGEQEEARQVLQRFQDRWAPLAQSSMRAAAPFLRLSLVQEATGVDPFFAPVLYAEGFALLREREFEQAIARFREAAARDALMDVSEPVTRAAAAFRDGAVGAALEHLEAELRLRPDRAELHRLRGLVHVADGQYESGIAALRTAARLSPEDERSPLALANALAESDQLAAAEEALQQTLHGLPASGRARYALARLYQRQGRYPEALREFEEAAAFDPLLGLNGIYQIMGTLERLGQNYDGAAEAFARRIDVHPNDPGAHQDLGDVYLRQGRHVEALAEFAVALMLDPAYARAYASMAQLHLRDARYVEAAEASRRALESDPGHREARYVLGTALVRLGRNDEGRQELQRFQTLQAEDAARQARLFELEGLRREALVAVRTGDDDQALVLLRRILEHEPDSPSAHLNLGIALLEAGRFSDALERLQEAAARGAHFDVHRYLADAYAGAGQREEHRREQALYEQRRREALRQRGTAGR